MERVQFQLFLCILEGRRSRLVALSQGQAFRASCPSDLSCHLQTKARLLVGVSVQEGPACFLSYCLYTVHVF